MADNVENTVSLTSLSYATGVAPGDKLTQVQEWQARIWVRDGLAVAETKTAAKELGVEPQKPVK